MNRQRFLLNVAISFALFALAGCESTRMDSQAPTKNATEALERVAEKGPVKLVIRVTPPEPRLSDLVEMDVMVTAQPGVEIKLPSFGQAVGDFVVRDYTERKSPTPPPGQPTTHHLHYQLEPAHAGRHLVRSLAIDFIDHRPDSESKDQVAVIESDPFEVDVKSEFGDKLPDLADLEQMLPPKPLASSIQWIWLVGAFACVVLAGFIYWKGRRKKFINVKIPEKTPEEIAHAALTALLAENLPNQGRFKDFYLRLTGIVRYFIEGTTGLKAPEQTTEEFLREMRLRNVFTPERSVRLKEFLEAADMVKYAGQQPDGTEVELSIARAREFVDLNG